MRDGDRAVHVNDGVMARMRPWMTVIVVALAACAAGACNRFRTSEEIRMAMRAGERDTTWLRYPCQLLVVDEFGWRADSLHNVQYRVHSSLRRRPGAKLYERRYETANRHSRLFLQIPVSAPSGIEMGAGLQQLRYAECSIADRLAQVVTGRAGFEFHTRVVWPDIGDGRAMVATASGRTIEEVQVMRAVLFTMRFPGLDREPARQATASSSTFATSHSLPHFRHRRYSPRVLFAFASAPR